MTNQPTLLELIEEYANRVGGVTLHRDTEMASLCELAARESRIEIERRLALAEADHPITWRAHLDNNASSQDRQRSLILQAKARPTDTWTARLARHARDYDKETNGPDRIDPGPATSAPA